MGKIIFGMENRGSGLGRANDELWDIWSRLNTGIFEESETQYILQTTDNLIFKAAKSGELVVAKMSNKHLSADYVNFEVYEGENPSGGYFLLYRFKEPSRRNEFLIATIMGLIEGSSISFKVV
jgi:hypothetical protein